MGHREGGDEPVPVDVGDAGVPRVDGLAERGEGAQAALGQAARPAVTSVVRTALGDDAGAWQRFATGPAGYAGHTAWLRLGDVLDAAADGTPWPTPPDK